MLLAKAVIFAVMSVLAFLSLSSLVVSPATTNSRNTRRKIELILGSNCVSSCLIQSSQPNLRSYVMLHIENYV